MDHVKDCPDHLRCSVGAYILVGSASVKIEMDAEETLVPAKTLLATGGKAAQDYKNEEDWLFSFHDKTKITIIEE